MSDCKYDHHQLLKDKTPDDPTSPFFWFFAFGMGEHHALPGSWPDGTRLPEERKDHRCVVWCSHCGCVWDGVWMNPGGARVVDWSETALSVEERTALHRIRETVSGSNRIAQARAYADDVASMLDIIHRLDQALRQRAEDAEAPKRALASAVHQVLVQHGFDEGPTG